MVGDLLEVATFGSTIYHTMSEAQYENLQNSDYFAQHFWGEKNQGFDVLYHNMKHGQMSVKSLQDFIRESIATEDVRAKHLTKLAKQAAGSSQLGSFAPMFEVFKVMAEKLSSCHMDVVQKLHDIVKELSKYLEKQKTEHKQVKDELSGTVNALHHVESAAVSVQKSKEKYYQLCMEADKLKKAGGTAKEIEKAETKSKKASEEYKNLVDKYATQRNEYEQKMTKSAQRFQEIEVSHLKQMKQILDSYIGAFENANVLVGQVHQDFRRQVDENSIDALIKNYSESKGTGTEKLGAIVFEECDVNSMVISADHTQTNIVNGEEPAPPQPTNRSRRPLNLPFRRKRARKPAKENANGTKETESMDSPEKDSSPKVDEEGYSIKPESPKEAQRSWGYDSSEGSDSDMDDYSMKKIHVKINPKDESSTKPTDNNLDALNAITKVLMLNSPTPIGGKKLTRRRSNRSRLGSNSSVSVGRAGSVTSNDVMWASPNATTPSSVKSFPATSPNPQTATPSKIAPTPGAVRVLPLSAPKPPTTSPMQAPIPAPRNISIKGDANKLSARRQKNLNPQNRFSTAFLDQDVAPHLRRESENVKNELKKGFSEESDDAEMEYFTHVHKPTPTKHWSYLTPPIAPTPTPSLYSSSESILQPEIMSSPSKQGSINGGLASPCGSPGMDKNRIASSDVATPLKSPQLPARRTTTNTINPIKITTSAPAGKSEKSSTDELFEFFGNNSESSAPPDSGSDANSFMAIFKSPPASNDAEKKPPTDHSLNNIFSETTDNERGEEPSHHKSKSIQLKPPMSSAKSTPALRPTNLTLNHSAPELQKVAPLASAESWSSLSSLGLTPVEGFATSRGPSPLPLGHGDPFPIAVSLSETVNALFQGSTDDSKCTVKIKGEVAISFPAGITRTFISNPNPAVLSFVVKGNSHTINFTPKLSCLLTDSSQTASSERSFWFEMPSLINHMKKMLEANPNSRFYNILALEYEILSQSGHSLVPLHLSSSWKCEETTTDVTINYKFNKPGNSHLRDVKFTVPINGGVTDAQSTPPATWVAAHNRLIWQIKPVTSSAPSNTLSSRLTLSAGPTTKRTLAVNFVSDGATATGSDFELSGSGYRLTLLKKRFGAGRYILEEK